MKTTKEFGGIWPFYREDKNGVKFAILMGITLLLFALLFILGYPANATPKIVKGQKQPDVQRVVEIQTALKAHGYEPGKTWIETREICRQIAFEHGWQNMWAPDPRVLALLGLSPKADLSVTTQPGNVLDQDARKYVEQNGVGKIK